MEIEEVEKMLKLKGIHKDYVMTDEVVHAIRDLDLDFRRNEFVAILGPSGCGKTTLLNIIGGLDRYTKGDLIIEDKSTKQYKDHDWDMYRNHSIGFVFQSYNLIGHISVLANVELALTLAGISRTERKARALEVLTIVGLKDKAKKKPHQLSGGQMQRVAIARALINNPKILLADEPTGALDSETSTQVLNLLKEVSENRLVIMVTHNKELAEKYATRIIKMSDGKIIDDSRPFTSEVLEQPKIQKTKKPIIKTKNKKVKNSAMSYATALGLSFNNMMTKKGRTILVSFAGSIGIIGIALILSVSFGFNNYISSVESDAMSTYPMTVYASSNMNSLLSAVSSRTTHELPEYSDKEEIVENAFISNMLANSIEVTKNDTTAFKAFLEKDETVAKYGNLWNGIQYTYSQNLQIYKKIDIETNAIVNEIINLSDLDDPYSYLGKAIETYRTDDPTWTPTKAEIFKKFLNHSSDGKPSMKDSVEQSFKNLNFNAFTELLNNEKLLNNQYDILAGHLPTAYNEVVLTVDSYNEINDYLLFGLGIKDASYLMSKMIYVQMSSASIPFLGTLPEPASPPTLKKSFSDLLNLTFSVGIKTQRYDKTIDSTTELGYHYDYQYDDEVEMKDRIDNSLELKIVGILRNKPDVNIASIKGAIGYSPELLPYLIEQTSSPSTGGYYEDATVLKDQIANPELDVLSGEEFVFPNKYETNLDDFGYIDKDHPEEIRIYPKDFESKQKITQMIQDYNEMVGEEGKITVSDMVGELFTSFQVIVDAVSYILIAFVSISLIVSSIMIGIITYVSVLERTKEIGILRSVGARKKDISRVFTAETLITGLLAGIIGVGSAFLLDIPIMFLINHFAKLNLLITVPWYGALVLPIISVILTLLAGLIPSSLAAKKDPVIALRSE